ncbi:hypothetical protein [Lacisediminimonas profundi]|uniref:hypothetical protein n=1 Tax=Lacisediminimonas profundi TaxID=2603856 RepID=UPI00124B66E9|nr:hypothetical protein [Lacisediminimonas profundi]
MAAVDSTETPAGNVPTTNQERTLLRAFRLLNDHQREVIFRFTMSEAGFEEEDYAPRPLAYSLRHPAAEAAQAGRNAASGWDADGGIDSGVHRLRSLMNFERDVIKSTADDACAIPQWLAFLDAYDKRCPSNAINMDDRRGRRFGWTLCSLCDALDSLDAMTSKFPQEEPLSDGEIDAEVAVKGVLQIVRPMTSLMHAMLVNEEAGCEYPGLLSKLQEAA